jgi:hypothetical protein
MPPDKTHPEDFLIASQKSPEPTVGSTKKKSMPKILDGNVIYIRHEETEVHLLLLQYSSI